MRLLEYSIKNQVFIKAEITKLTAYPIKNDTDNYYVVIPILNTDIPNNIMFINETLIIDPHTIGNYVPKFIKMGVTLSQSLATSLPNGVTIRLLIIDSIENMAINNIQHITVTSKNSIANMGNKSINPNHAASYITDNKVIKTDSNTMNILSMIDDKLNGNNSNNIDNNANQNYDVNEVIIKTTPQKPPIQYDTNGNPIKRGRGRPRKYPLPNEAREISSNILSELNSETTNN